MKTFLRPVVLFTALLFAPFCHAQKENILTEEDWNSIIPYLIEEDWVNAEKISGALLKRFKGEDEMLDEAGIIRYMYINSIGGLVGNKDIEKDEALKRLKGFEGKVIVTPFNAYKKGGMFNYLTISEDGKNWSKCVANESATVIHIFETFEMDDKLLIDNAAKYEGKNMRMIALIKEIKTGGFAMPRLEITYKSSEIWDMEGED
ncbi:MAG: hypothetical protein V4581_17980 [Bacteroidota bacterium]